MTTLFGSELPVQDVASDGMLTPYTLGVRFRPMVNGTISHVSWVIPTVAQPTDGVNDGSVTFALFRDSTESVLGQTSLSTLGHEGTKLQVAMPSPIAVVAGQSYTAAIFTPEKYVFTSGYVWPHESSDGLLVSDSPGCYFDGEWELRYPTFTFGNSNYFVDVVFTASSAGPALTVWAGTAEVLATVSIWTGTAEIPASLDIA